MENRDIWIIILSILVIVSLLFSVYNYASNAKKFANIERGFQDLATGISIQIGQEHKVNKILESELGIDFEEKIKEMNNTE